jgi:hypothetical protein
MIQSASRRRIAYQPPPGYYDLPFTWAYNASGLTIGNNYPNQFIYLLGGYGDFLCRRMAGINRILAFARFGGQFQIKDGNNNYIQSDPVFAQFSPDILFVPEVKYPELGAIRFDLYNYNPSWTNSPQASQLAFQGVRRLKGTLTRPDYKYKEKSFVYAVSGVLTNPYPAAPVTVSQVIQDYDFDLYQVIVVAGGNATLLVVQTDNPNNGLLFTSALQGSAGDAITITIAGHNVPNGVLGVAVAGSAITITLGTNGAGVTTSTGAQMLAAYNANPAAVALASLTLLGTASAIFDFADFGPTNLSGGAITPIIDPIVQLWLYDQNRVQISNMPINDVFMNGAPDSFYANGAIVPRLYYRQQSRIQVDLYSLLTAGLPQTITLYFVGRQLYPC